MGSGIGSEVSGGNARSNPSGSGGPARRGVRCDAIASNNPGGVASIGHARNLENIATNNSNK